MKRILTNDPIKRGASALSAGLAGQPGMAGKTGSRAKPQAARSERDTVKAAASKDSLAPPESLAGSRSAKSNPIARPTWHKLQGVNPLAARSNIGWPAVAAVLSRGSSDEAKEVTNLLSKLHYGHGVNALHPERMAEYLYKMPKGERAAAVDALLRLEQGWGHNNAEGFLDVMSGVPGVSWKGVAEDMRKTLPECTGFAAFLALRAISPETLRSDAKRKSFLKLVGQAAQELRKMPIHRNEDTHSLAVSFLQTFGGGQQAQALGLLRENNYLYHMRRELGNLPAAERVEAAQVFNLLQGHEIIGRVCLDMAPPSARLDLARSIEGLAKFGALGGSYHFTRTDVIPTIERVLKMPESSRRHANSLAEALAGRSDIDHGEVMKLFHRDERFWDTDAKILRNGGALPYVRHAEPNAGLVEAWIDTAEQDRPGARAHANKIIETLARHPEIGVRQKGSIFQLPEGQWDAAVDALQKGKPLPFVVVPDPVTSVR